MEQKILQLNGFSAYRLALADPDCLFNRTSPPIKRSWIVSPLDHLRLGDAPRPRGEVWRFPLPWKPYVFQLTCRHSGKANFAFPDRHVEALSLRELTLWKRFIAIGIITTKRIYIFWFIEMRIIVRRFTVWMKNSRRIETKAWMLQHHLPDAAVSHPHARKTTAAV